MPLNGSSYVPQPYYAYVSFKINGIDLIMSKGRPQHLINFTHRMDTNAAATWTLEIFDATFNLIEHELWEMVLKGQKPVAQFRYGYSETSMESPLFYSEVTNIVPKWGYGGTSLTFEGTHMPSENLPIPTLWYKKDRAFVDVNISDIILRLALENDYVIDFDHFHETEPIKVPHDINSTNPVHKIFEQKGMSLEQFVKHFLLPYAVRKGTKIGGYVFYIDHRFNPPHIRFYVPEQTPGIACPGNIKRTYTIRQDKMEEWVDFSYDLHYGPGIATGLFEEAQFSIDPHTGEYVFEKYNPENQKEYMRIYGHAYTKMKTTEKMNNIRMRPSHSPAMLKKEREYFHRSHLIRKFRGSMTASLTIVGNPQCDLMPSEFIRIYNMLPDGSLHYSSGCYMVKSIEHSISGGAYTTTFELERNGAETQPPKKEGQEEGGIGNPANVNPGSATPGGGGF